ncbi:MAG: copper chaperone PCu(A)C [Rhodobacteraceae bacterium]|jgi:copper(I)-binding protein|nr:copper chaperone PCu(A)C [Paracoccaceae bacterium]
MKYLTFLRSAAAAALLFTLPAGAALAHDGVTIHDGYVRSVPPTAPTAAGYLVIDNHRTVPVHITGVSSDVAAEVALHTMAQDAQGVMRMLPLADGITIPAGGTHVLKPGGEHVMFMGLVKPLEQGATVPVTFHFDGLPDMVVDLTVDQNAAAGAGAMGSMDHGAMHGGADQPTK